MTTLFIPPTYRPVVHVKVRTDRRGKIEGFYTLPPQHGEDRIRVRVTLPYSTMRDARIWAGEKQTRLSRGEFDSFDFEKMGVAPPGTERGMTLRDFMPRFKELRQRGRKRPLSERYIVTQDRIIESCLLPRFGDTELAGINVDVIDEFIGSLQTEEHPKAKSVNGQTSKRLKPHSINNLVGVLGRILTVAFRRGLIPARPIIEKLPIDDRDDIEDILTQDEVTRLLTACEGVHGRMIQAYILTGARAMELPALRWEDYEPKWGIDKEGRVVGRLHIRHQIQPYVKREDGTGKKDAYRLIRPKWNSVRWIPVDERLADLLSQQAALTRLQDGFVFLTERGKPFCHELIAKALRRACRRANMRVVTPQVLRRTYVSQSLMAGVHPKTVQQCAGHRSMAITMKVYTRLEDKFVLGSGRKLEEHLFGQDKSQDLDRRKTGF